MEGRTIDTHAAKVALVLVILSTCFCFWQKFRSISQLPQRFIVKSDYIEIGEDFCISGKLGTWRPPLYSAVVSANMHLLGVHAYPYGLAVVQGLALLLLHWLMWHLGSLVGGCPRWGLWSVALTALNIRLCLEFLTVRETFLYCLLLLILFRLLWENEITLKLLFILGLFCSLLWLTRPTGLLVAPSVLFAWFYFDGTWDRGRIRLLVLFTLGLLFPISLWLCYTFSHGMVFHISGNAAWENLYRSYNEAIFSYYPWIHINSIEPHMRKMREQWKSEGVENDCAFRKRAFSFIQKNPLVALELLPIKAFVFFWPGYIPLGSGKLVEDSDGQWVIREYRPFHLRRQLAGLAALPALLLAFVALFHMKKFPRATRFVYVVFFSTALLHTVLHSLTRHRLPFDPLLTIAAISVLKELRPNWFKSSD